MTNLDERNERNSRVISNFKSLPKTKRHHKAQISVRKALSVMFKWVSWIRPSSMLSQYLKH